MNTRLRGALSISDPLLAGLMPLLAAPAQLPVTILTSGHFACLRPMAAPPGRAERRPDPRHGQMTGWAGHYCWSLLATKKTLPQLDPHSDAQDPNGTIILATFNWPPLAT